MNVPRLQGQRVHVSGDGPFIATARHRLQAGDVSLVADAGQATDAVVGWPSMHDPGCLGLAVERLATLLRGGLRRVLLVVHDVSGPTARVAETLTIYAGAHLVRTPPRFNTLRLPASPSPGDLRRCADAMFVFLGGFMDAVHGQVLDVSEVRR